MSFVVAGAALFGAGLTATLSPCVLPLVPGYLALLADGATDRTARLGRVVAFASGAVLVFVALGAIVGAVGVDADHTARWVQRVAGVVLLTLGLLMLLGRSGRAGRSLHAVHRLPEAHGWRAFVLGAGCAAAWTPCAGPLLGAALTAAGGSGGVGRSSVLLLLYAAGVLVPFVALAAVRATRVPMWTRSAGRAMALASAGLMMILGVAFVAGWYDALISRAGLIG